MLLNVKCKTKKSPCYPNLQFSFSNFVLSQESDSSPSCKLSFVMIFDVLKDWIFYKFFSLCISLYHFSSAEVDAGRPPHFLLTVAKSATEATNPVAFLPPSAIAMFVISYDLDDSDFQISAPCFHRYGSLWPKPKWRKKKKANDVSELNKDFRSVVESKSWRVTSEHGSVFCLV